MVKSNNDSDSEILDKALDNEKNDAILSLTNKKINEMNLRIIKELGFTKQDTLLYVKKLKGYRFVDEIKDIRVGGFLKWIPIVTKSESDDENEYLPLHSGGIICDIKLTDKGTFIACKNFVGRFYQFKFDDVLIFQKLSNQELVILSALDHLAN
jgi:hypothetical protein